MLTICLGCVGCGHSVWAVVVLAPFRFISSSSSFVLLSPSVLLFYFVHSFEVSPLWLNSVRILGLTFLGMRRLGCGRNVPFCCIECLFFSHFHLVTVFHFSSLPIPHSSGTMDHSRTVAARSHETTQSKRHPQALFHLLHPFSPRYVSLAIAIHTILGVHMPPNVLPVL